MAAQRLAVDLGTSHTVAVVRRGADPPRALLIDGSPLMPSAVYAEPPHLHVGRDAERLALTDPSRFEPHPKRRVGDGSVLLGDTEVPVVDMLAALLRRVAAEAAHAGVPAGAEVVLTCPVDWGGPRRSVLLDAARAASLGPAHLVDEPVAAATYCIDVLGRQVVSGDTVAVFDFGGGTLDVSVLRRDPSGLRVLSVGGLDELGGVDVDAALVGHLGQLIALRSPRVWQRLTNPAAQSEQRERRQFWNEVRAAKEMLSRASSAPVHVPGLDSAVHLTRDELERVAGPLVDRAVDETRRVLQRAGVEPAALAGLFLVGGSSRIPLVASRLHTRFGLAPAVPEQPELPVAYGGLLAATGWAVPRQRTSGPHQPAAPHRPGYGPAVPVSGAASGEVAAVSAPPAAVSAPPGPAVPVSTPPSGPVPVSPVSGGLAPSYPPLPSLPPYHPAAPGSGPYPAGPPGTARPPGPPAGARPPGFAPPPRQRRRGTLRWVVLAVSLALVVSCGWGGYRVITGIGSTVKGLIDAERKDRGDGGNGATVGAGPAGELRRVFAGAVPGAGATDVAAGPDTAFYAGVDGGKTRIVAVNAADGAERWNRLYDMEPTELRIRQTGDLLVVEGESAATHQGRDVRLVVDVQTGEQKRLDPVVNQRVVAYYGGEVVVETTRPSKIERIDLASGTVRWKTDLDSTIVLGRLAYPSMVHAPDGPQGAQGRAGLLPFLDEDPGSVEWEQAVAAEPAIVTVDDNAGKAKVFDAATGKARANAAVPLRNDDWTTFAGQLIGQLTDKASPGRTTLAAFGVDNLAKRWELPLPAGADIERIRPCGPTQICVSFDGTAEASWVLVAVDLTTGKEAWKKTAGSSDEPGWYLTAAGLVCGQETFGSVDAPELCDPATGAVRHSLFGGQRAGTLVAASRRWGVLRGAGYANGGTQWTVTAVDLESGKLSSHLVVGAGQPKAMSITGNVVVAVADDRKVVAGLAPGGVR